MEHVPVALIRCGPDGRVRASNGSARRLLGVAPGGSILELCDDATHGSTVGSFVAACVGRDTRSQLRTSLAGTPVELLAVADGDDVVIACYDLSSFEDELEQVRRAARRDPLTGLANRLGFDDAAREAWVGARDRDADPAVAIFDLDQFKRVNDTYGHSIGDEVLRCVADRLASAIADHELAARFGGDEFVVCIPHGGTARAVEVAALVADALAEPFLIDGLVELSVSASCGIAGFDVGTDIAGTVREADAALYRAKVTAPSSAEIFDASHGEELGPIPNLARTMEALRRTAATDTRTGLARDHVLATELPTLVDRAARAGEPLSVLIVDLDRFHEFNALYLYEAGHRALRAVAAAVSGAVRAHDRCYRYGGEELAVVLEATDHDEALRTADRVRRAVEALGIPHADFPGGVLTVSVGVSTIAPGVGASATAVLNGAATAAFAAKSEGRNRVASNDPTDEEPRPTGR